MIWMILISIAAGVGIAIQSSLSGQLSKMLGEPLWAVLALYGVGFFITLGILVLMKTPSPSVEILNLTPKHLWFLGACFSVVALTLVYWQIPQIGISRVMIGVIFGQLFFSVLASHFGWFGLPVVSLSFVRVIGLFCMTTGVVLMNIKELF